MPDKHYELSKEARILLELTSWFHDLCPFDPWRLVGPLPARS